MSSGLDVDILCSTGCSGLKILTGLWSSLGGDMTEGRLGIPIGRGFIAESFLRL